MNRVRSALALALAVGVLPMHASAFCYTVMDRSGAVVWRSTVPPIDLSRSVSDGMRRVFPPGHVLVISEETLSCTPIGPQEMSGAMPGFSGPTPGLPGSRSGMTAGTAPK